MVINLSGSNMYDLWVIKWLCSRACDSESHYPWQNICNSNDTKFLPSVTNLVTPNKVGKKKLKWQTTQTITQPSSYWPILNWNTQNPTLTAATSLTMELKCQHCKGCESEFRQPWQPVGASYLQFLVNLHKLKINILYFCITMRNMIII
jgi:hypothetical protein